MGGAVTTCSICANVLPSGFVATNVLLCNHLMCGIWCYGLCIKGLFSVVSFPDPERTPAKRGSGDNTTCCVNFEGRDHMT